MHLIDNQDLCLMKSAKLQRFSATIAQPLFGTSKHIVEPVSIKHGLRSADYGLSIKHGLGYKTRTEHYVQNTDTGTNSRLDYQPLLGK